jgi:hypothetical protein
VSAQPITTDIPIDHTPADAHQGVVGGEQTPDRPAEPQPLPPVAALADPVLALAAEVVDDLERIRIANQNRWRQLTRTATDKDGEERGFGLTPDHPDVAVLSGIIDALTAQEHAAVLNLKRAMRKHPLGPWVKATVGVGEKQAARLLAAIGDPYWNTLHDRPRTVSELWAYCGLHTLPASPVANDAHDPLAGRGQAPADRDQHEPQAALVDGVDLGSGPRQKAIDAHPTSAWVAAKRRKGQRANWSTTAKTRAYLIAESCIKQAQSPYRPAYDARRAHTDITHPEWTAGHSHNDAMRIVAKEVLKGLWLAARDVHAAIT